MGRGVIAGILLAGLSAGQAVSGAWTLPEGQGQAILGTSRTLAPVGAHFGDPVESDTNSASAFLEYGAWNDVTVGITVYGEFSTTNDDVEARLGGHVRYRVWQSDESDVLSVQAGAGFPIERWLGNGRGASRPQSASEVDLRALYGRGWQWGLGNSFVSSELALGIRGEGLDEELRFDVTAGHEPIRGVLALFSVFSAFPMGNGSEASVKLSPSIAYTMFPWLGANEKKPYQPISPNTIQFGISWDAADSSSGLEIGLSIWRGF